MKNNQQKRIRFLTEAGMIAALYVTLTGLSALLGLSSGAIQLRISEALCILPVYTAAAVPGVTIGCLIANLLVGGTIYDIAFGTLATLIGALIAGFFRRERYLAFLPSVLSNTLIIPAVLIASGFGGWGMFGWFALTVGIGEILSCGVLGNLLIFYFDRHPTAVTAIFGERSVR